MKPHVSVATCWQANLGHFSVVSTHYISRSVPFISDSDSD